MTGGYTRMGAPMRHLTSRLLAQPSERRLLIVIGDGLMSDEGYEGRYAWADVAHAVDEANKAGDRVPQRGQVASPGGGGVSSGSLGNSRKNARIALLYSSGDLGLACGFRARQFLTNRSNSSSNSGSLEFSGDMEDLPARG